MEKNNQYTAYVQCTLVGKTALLSTDYNERSIHKVYDSINEAKDEFARIMGCMLDGRATESKEVGNNAGGEVWLAEFPEDIWGMAEKDFLQLDDEEQQDILDAYEPISYEINGTPCLVFVPENLCVEGFFDSLYREELDNIDYYLSL